MSRNGLWILNMRIQYEILFIRKMSFKCQKVIMLILFISSVTLVLKDISEPGSHNHTQLLFNMFAATDPRGRFLSFRGYSALFCCFLATSFRLSSHATTIFVSILVIPHKDFHRYIYCYSSYISCKK
jgi:hypothetical protein